MCTPPQPTSRGRWREEESLQADGKRQKAPQQTEGCALETGGRLLLETPFGVYAMEPVVATIHGVHVGRYSRKRRRVAEEDTMRESGCPDPRNDSQQKLNLLETHPRRLRRRRWLEVKSGTLRRFKTSKRLN
jgi:hypothetical protein